MAEEEKTTSGSLPGDVRSFLGMDGEAPASGQSEPSFGGEVFDASHTMAPQKDPDTFDERTARERSARAQASARMLFATDVTKLDDTGASALYQSVAEGLFGLPDEDGSVAFGKRASKDPRQNIDMLRKFVKGDYSLIEDPEYTKWREMDDEQKFQHAMENETAGNSLRSFFKGERGPSAVEAVTHALTPAIMKVGPLATQAEKETQRKMRYEDLTDEEKAQYRADVVADYDEKLSRRQTLATFLSFSQGLSDRAGWLLAKSFADGVPDTNIETLPEDERDRVYSAFSLMRGDQKKGRILGIQTDFTDGTVANRLQLGLYGFQQSVLGLVSDTAEMGRDAAMWAYAKVAMDDAERAEFFKGWDAITRAEQAMKQNLPEAEGIAGEAFQGLSENIHWFIPYSMIGKGGKMVKAARLGGALKEEKATLEAGKAAMEAAAEATKAAWTLDVNGTKKLGEMGKAILGRQIAAVDRYTEMLRSVENDLKAAKWWKDAAGTGMWAAGEASAFSAFASEYIANADAAGISREESIPTAAIIGLINAKIEQLYVPGLESSLTPAQIKSLMWTSAAQAIRSDGAAGFRKWLANRISRGVTEGAKVTLTEGAVEEPLQQMAIEHGKAFDRLCQELREGGGATLANEAKALWDSFAETLPKDYATFIDTAADMVPSSLGFGVTTIGNMTRRQHIHNVMTRHANRRAGSTSTMATAQTVQDLMGATDYDAGLVDYIQRSIDVRNAVERHWQGEGGEAQKNPHRFEEAVTAARQAFRDPKTADVVREVADAAGVDVKTAEVLTQYLEAEAEATAFSPQARAWSALNMSLADIDEQTIKTVLPGYIEGSFASDPENGIYSGRVKMGDGTERTIAYRVGDLSAELMAEAENMAKPDSAFGKSFDARHAEAGDGVTWAALSDAQRYAEAVRAQASVNGFSSGKSGVFEMTDANGEKVRVNADDVIYLANGRIGDIGYGPAATQGTVRHETFHSLWRFARASMEDGDVQQLAKTLGIDVTKDGWEIELDERMAHEMERYASGHYVSHAVSSRFDRMIDGWAGKVIDFFGQFGPKDEVTDPQTGRPYQLKDIYDKVLRGELGSGSLGVELAKIPAQPAGESAATSTMPVEVTDADRAEAEAATQAEAAKEEPSAPAAPSPSVQTAASVPVATSEKPADASTPNQVYYRVGLPNSNVKLVGRLEVRDAETGFVTSTDAAYHDRGNQNRDDRSEESRALVEKIGANPDPLQVGTVQPIASNGIVWMLPNGDVIIGNHRVNGVRLGYEKGTAANLEKFVREDAAKRGIEIGEGVKKPLLAFVLERIESPDGKADVHEVVRLANESQNRGFNVREQAGNDAKILIDNNLLPRMAFRADGRIDETKSGDAIGKFRQETGAQGMIVEDGSLTEEGQTRIQNAALASLLGSEAGNAALLQKVMANAGRLDMQGQLRALMKLTPELMALAEAKPGYDLRAPLAEALQLFTEWRDRDETGRVEKGKTRHDWRETKNGNRVRGISWEQFMSQGDMFRKPTDEARILGDLFARAEAERSFDREDVESAAGKKRVIDLISDYLTDYISNARAVNTETDDMFGGSPATRAEVMAAQRARGENGPRFSIALTLRGGYYWATGNDAEKASPHLGTSVVVRNGTPTTAFPAGSINTMLAKLIRNGMSATLRHPTPDGGYQERTIEPGIRFSIGGQTATPQFKEWFGDWENDPANASKVVDEDGRPLVVYHDTNSTKYINRETGEDWDLLTPEQRSEWDNRDDWDEHWKEQDFWTFDTRNARSTIEFPAFFFAPKPDPYHEYGKRRIAAYLNMRNPAVDPVIHDRSKEGAGREEMERLKAQGHDGIIRTDDEGNIVEYAVFDANQIKSATDNIGTFDPENPDMRYSFAIGETGATNLDDALFVSSGLIVAGQMLGDRDWEKVKKDERLKIKLATGWEKGADGKWRHETVDFPEIRLSRLTKPNPEHGKGEDGKTPKYLPVRLADVFTKKVGRALPLFNAYPWLKDVTVQYGAQIGSSRGQLSQSDDGSFMVSISEEQRPDAEGVRKTLIHELQHAIQRIEGFALGGNTSTMEKLFLKKFDEAREAAHEWNRRFYAILRKHDKYVAMRYQNYPRTHAYHQEAAAEIEADPEWPKLEEDRKAFRKEWGHDPKYFIDSDWGAIRKASRAGFQDYRKLAGEVEARNASVRTPGDAGTLLSDTEDVPRRNQIIRFSVAALLDEERRELEAKGGKLLLAYHGTQSGGFTVFDQSKNNGGMPGFFFAKDRDTAMTYSSDKSYDGDDDSTIDGVFENRNALYNEKGLYKVALRMERPLEVDAQGRNWDQVPYEGGKRMTREIVEDAFSKGYDGVIFRNVLDNGSGGMSGWLDPSDVYAVKASNQIKAADEMVYADDGSIIPEESRLDWSNPDIRYSVSKDLQDAMRRRELLESIPVEGKVQPWPENFPKVMLQTTLANIRRKWPEIHEKAKAGSEGAAIELVRNILGEERVGKRPNPKWGKLRALAAAHPRAIIAHVHAEEATGRNKIPAAYAYMIHRITGLRFTAGIVQTVRAHHTGANAVERMTRRAQFGGPVQRGAEYILVDDHVTQGGTLNELRKYIQSHGGKVVAVTTLTASQFSDTIRISSQAIEALYRKFGNDLDQRLKEAGIANGVAELTQSQARELSKLRADTLRDRLAAARLDRDNEALLRNGRRELLERSGVSGRTDLIPGLKDYFKPDGTSTETGTRWANARQFQRAIGRELNSTIDDALLAKDLTPEETAALLDRLIASAEASDEIRNGVLPNFRSDSSTDDPSVTLVGPDGRRQFTPERKAVQQQVYDKLMDDTISGANNEALETRADGTAKEEALIVAANEGRPDLPPIPLQNPTYETRKDFRIDIIVGPPAAGKSSVFANALSVWYRSRILDCDACKKGLPGFNDGNGANYVHAESSRLNKRMIYDIQHRAEGDPRRGENVVLPVLGDDVEGLRKKVADWHAVGYTVYLHNNRVPILHAFGRALLRTLATGRWINPDVIKACQDNPTRAYNEVKKEADYYDQFSNDVPLGEKPVWEDGNYLDPAYGDVRRLDGQGAERGEADGTGADGRLGRSGLLGGNASVDGQYLLPSMEGDILFSTEAPRSRLAYPSLLNTLSDEELLSAAVASRIALGKSDKVSDRSVKINTVQKLVRRLHPEWDTSKVGVESQRVISDAQKFAKRIREDLDRGVSDSLILEHLPDTMRQQFGHEMRQEAREGARLGAFGARANAEIAERQARIVEDAVRVQTGIDADVIENAYGINLSETIMHLAENPLAEQPPQSAGSGSEDQNGQAAGAEEEQPAAEIDARVKAAVEDIIGAAKTGADADERNRQQRRAAAKRDEERAETMGEDGGEESASEGFAADGDGDALAAAVAKEGLSLENPRHLARFVAELARRQYVKERGLALDADVWRDLVAVQFLRKTAQSVYAKLCRDLTYSRSRETAMQRIAKLDSVPTLQGLLSEMEFVGALVNAQRIRDTQKQMCEKLDLFLRERFGAQGRFKPDKEEGKRNVSAEAELRARYMRHAMWLTPDAAAEEARQLQETLDALSHDFKDAGRDRDQSREFVETIRKLNVLREFGALRYKPVGEIEAAIRWWEDFERGESDDIARDMADRDIRTKKAAHLLAVAFADPGRVTMREGGKADALNRFITGHMGFVSLLQDCMRHASDADRAAVKDIVDYISREIQKSGDRTEAEKRRHSDAFRSAVESIYCKRFNSVMKDMMALDERFLKYMGVVGGKRVTPTKGRALQLLVSLLQEGRRIEVEDEENPGKTKFVWEGGYHDNIVKHKREGQAAEIMRLLTPQDMNMLKWLGQWYEQNRSDLSDVCHSLFGIGVYAELPNYFPVKMLLEKQGLEKGDGVGWTIFPKALTPRVRNERDFDTSADIFSMWASRMEEAAQWKHHARLGLEMRGIFGRGELRSAVTANHGASVDALMQGFITDILAGHGAYDRSTAGVQYFSDQIRGWTALCALGGNIGVMAKQTTSIPAFGFEIGLVDTAKHVVTAFTPDGMAAMSRIWNSEQRKTRWRQGSSEAIRNALNQQNAGILKRMLQASMVTTKMGDVVPALVVGQGIYRDCLARGMSEDDAMAETWSIIERTQQSGRMENQTSIQRRNKLGRIMFQFLSTQQQYLQYEVKAIREVIARPDSVKRWGSLGRAILLNHFVLSSAYYWMGQLYKYALGQEPPEDELKDWIVTCLLGPYGSLFVAGFCCKYTLERAIKGYSIRGGSSMLPMESWLKTQVNDGAKLLEAIFDSDGDTWDNMLEAAGKWMSDSNSTVRDLRKLYRYRIKEEPQR